jgi:hypothetical protein
VNSSNVTWLAHQRRALCCSQKKQRQTTDIVSRAQQGGYVFMVVCSINAVKSFFMTVAFFCMGMPYLCYSTTEKQASEHCEKNRHQTLRLPQEESMAAVKTAALVL